MKNERSLHCSDRGRSPGASHRKRLRHGQDRVPGQRDSAVDVPFHRRAMESATRSRSTRTTRCRTPACGRISPPGCTFATSAEREIVRDAKKKVACVACDFKEELKKHRITSDCKTSSSLRDGNDIRSAAQRFNSEIGGPKRQFTDRARRE
jgi:hypothetical protein